MPELVEIGEREHGLRPCQVLGQAAIAHLGEAPELLDHAKGVLAASAGARARPIDHPPALAQRAAGSRAPIDPIAHPPRLQELPVVFLPVRLVAEDLALLPMQQFGELSDIGHRGIGRAYAVDDTARVGADVLEVIEGSQLQAPDIWGTFDSSSVFCLRLQDQVDARSCMSEIIDRIELCDDGIRVTLKLTVSCSHAGVRTTNTLALSRFVPLILKRRGVETRIVIAAGNEPPRRVDPALLKAVARGRQWADDLLAGRMESVAAIATRDGVLPNYVRRLTRLAFLAPRIVEAIVAGHHPPELSAKDLTERIDLPLLWGEQERAVRIS
jgi:hypothetical protein